MIMNLTIGERFLLKEILPDHGTMLQMITMESIHNKTYITVKDIKKYSIVENKKTGYLDWNTSIDKGEDFELDPVEIEFLKNRYKELDERGEITMRTFFLCKKIRDL
nr:MAG TPA: hypothetical protein [Caudoviricetes sp.]